jgi:hypothetical protein
VTNPDPSIQNTPNPPKPVLTLRVGVTGHRPKPARLPPDAHQHAKEQLGLVFRTIDAALHDLHGAYDTFYSNEPWRVRLVTGMAEGADQLALYARPDDWAVDAVLPFPRDSYREDFQKSAADPERNVEAEFDKALKQAETVLELPEIKDHDKRDRGYARLGDFLIRQIDVLVAVWDGQVEEGVGGTAQVIRRAVAARVPVVWIAARPDMQQGLVFARMIDDFEDDGTPVAPAVDCTKGSLKEAISTIVALPQRRTDWVTRAGDEPDASPTVIERLSTFLGEDWPRPSRCILYDFYKRLVERKSWRLRIPVAPLAQRLNEWNEFLEAAPPVANLGTRLREVLLPRYLWADQLAVDFSNRYRSAYIFCYLFSAVAVAIALLGIFLHVEGEEAATLPLRKKWILVFIELIVIFAIVAVYRRGRKHHWHERWIEYRALAEMLRDLRFLAYLAEYGRIQRAGVFESTSSAWFLWYLRATIRELGLPQSVIDGTYQHALLAAVERHVIADQLNLYHRPNAATLARMNARLHKLIFACFIGTLAILIAFWLCWPASWFWSPAGTWFRQHAAAIMHGVTLGAALLPALGAALAGILETGDFRGFARRSARTVSALEHLQTGLDRARRTVSLDDTSAVLVATAQVLTEDLAAWQALYTEKRLNLPV